ncbi:MAG: hypothetical protein ACK5PF_02120, partial [bacterium]
MFSSAQPVFRALAGRAGAWARAARAWGAWPCWAARRACSQANMRARPLAWGSGPWACQACR